MHAPRAWRPHVPSLAPVFDRVRVVLLGWSGLLAFAAMDTAPRNSAEMLGSLTLYMNKVRQAAITREIIEVVSGAQAL